MNPRLKLSQEPLRYLLLIRQGRYAPIENWWTEQDSNLQPRDYETPRLTIDISVHNEIEGNLEGEPKHMGCRPSFLLKLGRVWFSKVTCILLNQTHEWGFISRLVCPLA